MPPPGVLRSLDLFSGVGGITIALHGLAQPVAYCDWAPTPRRVLQDNMRAGRLPKAPVSTDVRELDLAWLRRNCKAGADVGVDLIVGGFPCVGFSAMGLLEGFENTESALFFDIMRLTDQLRPSMLFLENVQNVLKMGMNTVIEELAVKRGYELRWCVVPAERVGAPHRRARWFCLALKPGYQHVWPQGGPYAPFPWTARTTPARAVPLATRATHATLALMGNSVVPDAVRYAFLFLLARCSPMLACALPTVLAAPPGVRLEPAAAPGAPLGPTAKRLTQKLRTSISLKGWPNAGVVGSGGREFLRCPGPPKLREPPRLELVFDPRVYKPTKPLSQFHTSPELKAPFPAKRWATPRHGCTGASHVITERTLRDLPTQVRFEVSTPDALRGGGVNPVFSEWLMGYPPGWTRAATDPEAGAEVVRTRGAAAPTKAKAPPRPRRAAGEKSGGPSQKAPPAASPRRRRRPRTPAAAAE